MIAKADLYTGNDILRFDKIDKSFSGVHALKEVSFGVQAGKVHALLGENGAGKSTLMKILSGAYTKDSGTLYINDSPVNIGTPQDAERLGIAVIYQELNLIPELTVAENIFLNRQPKRGPVIDWVAMKRNAENILGSMELEILPNVKINKLRLAQRQMVEIAKAISLNSRILVMDEPTSSLSEGETQKLFKVIYALKSQNITIIYISHRLEEVFEICDNYSVMRDGACVHGGSIKNVGMDQIVEYMVGRTMSQVYPVKKATLGDVLLEVKNIGDGKKIKDISFSLRAGEILGFGGLIGAGRTEAMRLLFGVDRKTDGTIKLRGKPVRINRPLDAIKNGIGFLPEDRRLEGLVTELNVLDNVLMAKMETAFRRHLFSFAKARTICSKYVNELGIKTPSLFQKTKYLSGGNQQKVVLSKWLNAAPQIIILDEPTRGIDVNAKMEIYNIIANLADEGRAIILISSELPELIGLCDRVLIMYEGKINGELGREQLSQSKIMMFATGGKTDE
jgi:ABC-type sugar transport system ATPase subunit